MANSGKQYEENLSTKQNTQGPDTRVPGTHGDARGTGRNKKEKTQGTQTSGAKGLISPAFSYPRESRLRKKKSFTLCYETGKRFHSTFFLLFVSRSQETHPVTGFAVSRKISNAVKRNRIKRLLREFFRLNKACLPLASIMVVPKRGQPINSLRLMDIENDLLPLMKRLKNLENA